MQRVFIDSDPPGASVELEKCGASEAERKTPATLLLPRRVKRCTVLLLHDGYVPARVMLERRYSPRPVAEDGIAVVDALCDPDLIGCDTLSDLIIVGTVGALLWGVGKGVDAIAGSNYQLEPRDVLVTLQPDGLTRRSATP